MRRITYFLSLFLIFFDQFSKILVLNTLEYGKSVVIVPSFFSFTRVQNTGGAFSILSENRIFLIFVSFLVLFLFLFYLRKKTPENLFSAISLGLVLGGLVGNLIDRIFRGGVIDFLDFTIFGYSFPIFNLADIFIVIGVFLLLFEEVR